MAVVSNRNSNKYIARRPYVECYIDGRLRRDAVVELAETAAGFGESKAYISFTGKRFPHTPAREGDEVYIYINRAWNPTPIFHGWIRTINDVYDMPDMVSVKATDGREGLDDDVAGDNYNEVDWESGGNPGHHARTVIARLHRDYVSWQGQNGGNYIAMDLAGIEPNPVGTLNVVGSPHGQSIEQVQRVSSLDSRKRTYLKPAAYHGGRETLSVFRIGSGQVKNITYATRDTLAIESQPHGWPIANKIDRVRGDSDYITSLIMRSRKRRFQRTFTVEPAWDSSIQSEVLANYDKYTRKLIQGEENPYFNPLAVPVGRRYLIPRITLTDPVTGRPIVAHAKLLPELLDGDPTTTETKKARPFVVVKYAGDANYYVMFQGFEIKGGKWLVFQTPPIRPVMGVDGYLTPSMPENVYLTAAYEDESRLSVQVNATTNLAGKRIRKLIHDETCVWDSYYDGTYKLQADGTVVSVPAVDLTNDSVTLNLRASARLKELASRSEGWRFTMPFCPTHFRVGDTVALNGRKLEGVAVMRVQYALGQAFNPDFKPYCIVEVGAGR